MTREKVSFSRLVSFIFFSFAFSLYKSWPCVVKSRGEKTEPASVEPGSIFFFLFFLGDSAVGLAFLQVGFEVCWLFILFMIFVLWVEKLAICLVAEKIWKKGKGFLGREFSLYLYFFYLFFWVLEKGSVFGLSALILSGLSNFFFAYK